MTRVNGRLMRSSSILSLLLVAHIVSTLSEPSAAQEYLPLETPEESTDRVDSVLNAPDPSDHAGLLGKVFMQQRYLQLPVDEPAIRQIDKTLQGFDTFVNLPAVTLDLPVPLDFDVFFGYTNVGLKGSISSGPPLDIRASLNAKAEVFSVGTTIYPTWSERWRPFVQVGAEFSRSDVDVSIISPLGGFADNFVERDTSLLLNVGFEVDLLDFLGYRMTLLSETSDRFGDSILLHELILWPHERIFIRGGVGTALESDRPGFAIGGGLAF